nr:hypothetical protein [Tanacetum cinerariifolium]
MHEVILFYNGLEVLTRQILNSKGAIPSKTATDAKVAIQDMVEYSQKWHNGTSRTRSTKTSDGLAAIQAQLNNLRREINKVNDKVYVAQVGCEQSKRHEENSNMIKEIRASTDAAIRNQGASIKTLDIQIRKMSKLLRERGFRSLPSSSEANPRDHVKSISTNVEAYTNPIRYFIILDMPEDVKVPLILERPFLSTAHAKIDVFKKKITLRVEDEKIIFKSMKPTSSLIKRIYMLSLRERMELDFEARLMGETLVLNRSLDSLYGDYIELNDLNEPLKLRRDQVDDLMPTIKEGEVIDEFMIDIIKTRKNESFYEYPSFYDFDRKIHIDCAYNLRFSCMIVVANMDGYRDQDMGDIILGKPFCKASCVEAKRFDGLITIHNGSDNVTYQMA